MSELDEFVGESETETETETEVQETAPEPTETQTAETDAVPATAEPQSQETHEPSMVPLAAKQAEKDRRQKAERERDAALAQLNRANQQDKPDIFDNPDQVLNGMRMEMRAEFSEALARREHNDYDEVMDHYSEMVKANPAIHAQVMADPLSAMKAYEIAQQDKAMKEIGDPTSYRDRMKEELRAELMAEMNQSPNVPPDLTTARNTGSDATVNDAESLEEILGR